VGQKVHPVGFRLGVVKDWDSKWYANKLEYADLLHEDLEIKSLIKERFFPGRRFQGRDRTSRQSC
jgi:small subunit ribosomal protein S3